jgi:hypothetical protein
MEVGDERFNERITHELGQLNPNSAEAQKVRCRFQSNRKGVQIIAILRRQFEEGAPIAKG